MLQLLVTLVEEPSQPSGIPTLKRRQPRTSPMGFWSNDIDDIGLSPKPCLLVVNVLDLARSMKLHTHHLGFLFLRSLFLLDLAVKTPSQDGRSFPEHPF